MLCPTRRIYIAGPMTGCPDLNFPAFHEAAARWRQAGWQVVNPAENFDGRTDLPRALYIRADVLLLLQCSAVAFLPGWENSQGAVLEFLLATELGLDIFDAVTGGPLSPQRSVSTTTKAANPPQESILTEAMRLTANDRQKQYGHPCDDFARTAQMWTGILASKLRPGEEITASDIPLCMISVKLARQAHRHKRDNLVDIAGYARTAAMTAGDE
jgi:hypothetical protein